MYTLRKTKRIEASHQLTEHDGKCARLHGHTWAITVEVEGGRLHSAGAKVGMLFDYYDLGQLMKQHVEVLDHQHLNTLVEYPTSENIARHLYDAMAQKVFDLSGGMATLSRVLVSETQDSMAEYRP